MIKNRSCGKLVTDSCPCKTRFCSFTMMELEKEKKQIKKLEECFKNEVKKSHSNGDIKNIET